MKCKNSCGKDLTGRQLLYCSDKCRMQHKRQAELERDAPQPEQINPNTQPEQPKPNSVTLANGSVIDRPEYEVPPWVKDFSKTASVLTQSMLDSLPKGVSKPTGQPNDQTHTMTASKLNNALAGLTADEWTATPEYAELIYRLLTLTVEELAGQWIPVWKMSA